MSASSFFRGSVALFALASVVTSAPVLAQQLSQTPPPNASRLQSDRAVPERSDSTFAQPGQAEAGLSEAEERPVSEQTAREMSGAAAPPSFGAVTQKD